MFLSARPHGTRPETSPRVTDSARFYPRARMGRDFLRSRSRRATAGFYPRARMGRDTRCKVTVCGSNFVSIRAPAWDATLLTMNKRRVVLCFYPRARMGRDAARILNARLLSVSIRAPAWDATGDLANAKGLKFVSIRAPAWDAT